MAREFALDLRKELCLFRVRGLDVAPSCFKRVELSLRLVARGCEITFGNGQILAGRTKLVE